MRESDFVAEQLGVKCAVGHSPPVTRSFLFALTSTRMTWAEGGGEEEEEDGRIGNRFERARAQSLRCHLVVVKPRAGRPTKKGAKRASSSFYPPSAFNQFGYREKLKEQTKRTRNDQLTRSTTPFSDNRYKYTCLPVIIELGHISSYLVELNREQSPTQITS